MKKSENKSESNPVVIPEHYDSIDTLPTLFWDKIHKTNDLSYLLLKRIKLSGDQIEVLGIIWEKLYNEYISVFGFGDNFNSIMEIELKIAKLKLKKILSNDESIQNFIDINNIKLNALKNKSSQPNDIYKIKMFIEKGMQIKISLIDTPVREFYGYVKFITDGK